MTFVDNKSGMNIPWVESPLFEAILEKYYSPKHGVYNYFEYRELARHYNKEGYIVIDVEGVDFEKLIFEVESADETYIKKQEGGYHYSDSPRIFEGWRWNQHILDLARHPDILRTLEFLYHREPVPFQTINFKKGSNQPLHSDDIHFSTNPKGWVAGVWVALEDMGEENGTLAYVPRSHKLPYIDFQSLWLLKAEYGKQFESYATYEKYIQAIVESGEFEVKPFLAKRGQALIWASNLIHGGMPIKDKNRTRWSQATHYYFPPAKAYAPMFSDASAGDYAWKDMSNKDIMGHTI